MEKIGMVERKTEPDIFGSLISSIISQQISTVAASTVISRLTALCGSITPHDIMKIDVSAIQKCGMTMRKAEYIKDVTEKIVTGKFSLDKLPLLSDKEIIKVLVSLKGIGEWTAEMMLIHTFQRPDVLSYKDLGIRRGIMRLYELSEYSKKDHEVYKKRYSPYSTVASIYLWKISAKDYQEKN